MLLVLEQEVLTYVTFLNTMFPRIIMLKKILVFD